MFPRLPPRPSWIEYSLMEERYFDATQGNIKQMAQNPDTFWMPTKPFAGWALHESISSDALPLINQDTEIWMKKKSLQKIVSDEFTDEFEEHGVELFALNTKSGKIPLSIRILEYFSHRHPQQFYKAITQLNAWEFDKNISPGDMLLFKRSPNVIHDCDEEFIERLTKLQKKNHRPNEEEMNMLKILSTLLIKESHEHIAVMLKGCGRSLMEIQDAEKVNTYFRHPSRKKLYRCMHKVFGSRLCWVAPNEKAGLIIQIHRAINIKSGGMLPAYVASIKRPTVQYKWLKNKSFPHGVGDTVLPENTSSLCLPFIQDNNVLGVFELLRFKDFSEFKELDKCLAQELLGLTQAAINLSIQNSHIRKSIASHMTKDLFMLQYNFLAQTYTVDDILKRIPLMLNEILHAEKCYVVLFRDNEMILHYTEKGKMKTVTGPLVRKGLFLQTAMSNKIINIKLQLEQILSQANRFIWDHVVKKDLSPESFKLNRFNFLIHPVVVEVKPEETNRYRESLTYASFTPIHIHKIYTENSFKEHQVLCVITAVNKKNWNNEFDNDDENLMECMGNTMSSILRIAKCSCDIQRNVQLLDLAVEVMQYQTTPTHEEIERACINYHEHKNLIIPDFEDVSVYAYEFPKQITVVVHLLVQLLHKFSIPLEKIVNYTLSVQKRITKDNPYHNPDRWFIVSHATFVWCNKFCQRFTEWERISLFLAANMTCVGHRGLSNNGLLKLGDPLIKLFPKSPYQNLAFEMCSELIVGPNGLFDNLKQEEGDDLLKRIKRIFLMEDMVEFAMKKPFYHNLKKEMDWSNETHRLAVLELLLFLCTRDHAYKPVFITLDVILCSLNVELLNEGRELFENGFEVPFHMNVDNWRSWPEYWVITMEQFHIFASDVLASVLPETAILKKIYLRNHDYLADNVDEVRKRIKKVLRLSPKKSLKL